jgi:glycosyltransferase involved in cell wall biosynthesis
LAYIIGTYPLLTTTFIDREVQALREMGRSIQILSIRRPPDHVSVMEKYREAQNNIIYLLPVVWAKFILAHLHFASFRPYVYFKLLAYLLTRAHPRFVLRLKTLLHFAEGVYAAHLLRKSRPDHVHAHFIDRAATVALCVSRLLKVSYSLTAHANDIYIEPVLVNEKIGESKFTVTVSEFNKAFLLKHYPGLDLAKIFVLHPWVDLSRFQPPKTRASCSRLRILSVGRLVEKKGHRYLIEACHCLQKDGLDFDCHIIGDGPLRSDLQAMVTQRNLADRIHLMGGQPQEEILIRLSRVDVFVLPCVIAKDGDRDGMPVALAEAMAMEVPVISTDVAGIREVVRPGAGYLVPPKDSVALAEVLKTVKFTSVNERVKMGRHGRAVIAEEFDLFKGTRHLANLFQKTVEGN